jgi:hypothetical protein
MPNCLLTPTPHWPTQRCAYRLIKAELDAIPAEQLIRVDIDIPAAADVVLARMPRIRAMRSAIASSLADFDMRAVDRLDLYARAMHYAHWLYQSAHVSFDRLQDWIDEWPAVHERLVAEARRLLENHVLDRSSCDACPHLARPCQGSTSTQRLCCLLNLNWKRIESTTNLRWDELAHAEVLGELASIVEDQGDDLRHVESILTLNRQRAFALFLANYDQVRRAMQFIRWNEGDADELAPALLRVVPRRRLDSCPPISSQCPIGSPANVHKKTETA